MTKRITATALAVGVAAGMAAFMADTSVDAQSYQRVRCESRDGREVFCRASIGGDARLVRQLSSVPCRQGQNWRWTRDGFYVRDGCRAEFEYVEGGWWGGSGGSGDARLRCESERNRDNICAAQIGGNVTVVRQLSDTACIEGRTWSWDRNGIRVWNGCRAEFSYRRSSSSGGGWGGSGSGYDRLRCESERNRDNFCTAQIGGNVTVVRQLSDTACIEGRTWSWDRNGIRVWNGCRAEFSYRRSSSSGGGWGSSGGSGSGWDSFGRMTCQSQGTREQFCPATISGDVRVVRQLSGTACVQGRTWNWNHDGIRVWGGCRAEFEYREASGWGGGGGGWGGSSSSTRRERISCESKDYRERFCRASISGDVRIVKQKSDRPCIQGRTWSWSHDGIRVWDGCAADFDYLAR